MPFQYQSHVVNGQTLKNGMTRVVAPLTANSVFGKPGPGVGIRQIIDGTSNTMMVVEAGSDKAVVWTKPKDVKINFKSPVESIINKRSDGFFALFCDGSVQFTTKAIDHKLLNGLITINGKERLQPN